MSARESGVEHAGVKGEAEESPPAGIVLRDGDLPKIFDAVVAALAREATNLRERRSTRATVSRDS
jgi:hypothetical protein